MDTKTLHKDAPNWIKTEDDKQDGTLIIRGERISHKLDEDIREDELLGVREKVAVQGFRDNPQDEAKVIYHGKESKHWREDLKQHI